MKIVSATFVLAEEDIVVEQIAFTACLDDAEDLEALMDQWHNFVGDIETTLEVVGEEMVAEDAVVEDALTTSDQSSQEEPALQALLGDASLTDEEI